MIDKLKDDVHEYGKDWCLEAAHACAVNNAHSYNYFHKVLENRKSGNGKDKSDPRNIPTEEY